MATESPVRLIGSSGTPSWPMSKDAGSFASSPGNMAAQDLGLLLKVDGFQGNKKITVPNRSGSAPPSVDGSLASIRNLVGHQNFGFDRSVENLGNIAEGYELEEQLRADPAYVAYYSSNVHLNPRLPPPLISQETRRLMHHIGGLGDNRKIHSFDDSSKGSFFVSHPVLSTHEEEPEDRSSPRLESYDHSGRSTVSVYPQFKTPSKGYHKSLVDLIQEDFPRTPSPVYHNQVRSSNQGVAEELCEADASVNASDDSSINLAKLSAIAAEGVGTRVHTPIPVGQLISSVSKDDLAASSIPCLSSSDRTGSPHPGRKGESDCAETSLDSGGFSTDPSGSNIRIIESGMKNLKVSNDGHRNLSLRQHAPQNRSQARSSSSQVHISQPQLITQGIQSPSNTLDPYAHNSAKLSSVEVQPVLQSTGFPPPLYATAAAYGSPYYSSVQPSSLFTPQYSFGGYALSAPLMAPFITGYPSHSAMPLPMGNPSSPNFNARTSGLSTGGGIAPGVELQNLYKVYGQLGVTMQPSFPDPFYVPYFQQPPLDTFPGAGQLDPMVSRGNPVGTLSDNYELQKGPNPAAYLPDQRPQFLRQGSVISPSARKAGIVSPSNYGSPPNIGVLMQYPTSPLGSPVFQGSPMSGASFSGRRNENMRAPFSSGRNASSPGWQGQKGRERADDAKSCSFLEEFKSNKGRRFELSEIAGRIVEFSSDQHGSRFIQQKLENCSIEEKASVFEEILPHASRLMTDVFGNYVIQKFFEHGSPEQRKELADQLNGRVLALSLQMYGCRVIQKALEVIELDQKTQLVQELDGHVIRCVRDQNGNHVVQKCIECVPTDKIGFIISAFRGQVATLSTHPYGCRVIQRALEHCTDELQSQCIVDEILQSACVLAQDQYGNYVTQHVLERGKPHERSQIITKLAGQIVTMSQHKFASNVIEKCLEHGDAAEREYLIEEIVGQTEGNDNLLIMMKDQFANYVVQKILETCTDKQREILLDRIKVHLPALKKYTYGKHIVARVEQLCVEEDHSSEL